MKKIYVLVLFFLFVLTGCHKTQTVKVNTSSLNLRTVISYKNIQYEGIFKSDKDVNCEFQFMLPDSLKGFTLCVNNGTVSLKYLGLEYDIPQSDLSETIFLYEICEALKELPGNAEIPYLNEKIIYEGNCNGRAFTLEFDPEGIPASLAVKSLDLNVKFYKY